MKISDKLTPSAENYIDLKTHLEIEKLEARPENVSLTVVLDELNLCLMLRHLNPEIQGLWGFPGGKMEAEDWASPCYWCGGRGYEGVATVGPCRSGCKHIPVPTPPACYPPLRKTALRELYQETGLRVMEHTTELRPLPAQCVQFPERDLNVIAHPFWTTSASGMECIELKEPTKHNEWCWFPLDAVKRLEEDNRLVHPVQFKILRLALFALNQEKGPY